MDQRIIDLYDEYTHAPLSRNAFLSRLALITGSFSAALALLPALESNYKGAVKTSDDELITGYATYPGINGEMKAYFARPREDKKYAAVVVIHENRGLNAHIEDVARRAAGEGFFALAPNALAPFGGTPSDEDEARRTFSRLDAEESLSNFIRAFEYLDSRRDCNGNFGCVGFCWGGAMANNLAVNVPELKAAVAFYGRQPNLEKVSQINAAVQLHYAELDQRINAGKDAYENALNEAGKTYESYLYEGVNHAFHNDTSEARYNEKAAKLAWQRTIAFFNKHLK